LYIHNDLPYRTYFTFNLTAVDPNIKVMDLHLAVADPRSGDPAQFNPWYSPAILQHLLGTRCMQSTNIYKVKPILFLVKKCANWLQTARTENGGGVGWQHACAMQTNMVPLNFFSIVAPMFRPGLLHFLRCVTTRKLSTYRVAPKTVKHYQESSLKRHLTINHQF